MVELHYYCAIFVTELAKMYAHVLNITKAKTPASSCRQFVPLLTIFNGRAV